MIESEGRLADLWPGIWACAGFTALLLSAVYRLSQQALGALAYEFTPLQVALLVANVVFMAYSEGFRGFQQRFSPRFAGRAWQLNGQSSSLEKLLAPFYAMGLFRAPRRDLIVGWSLTALIVAVVIVFRFIPQPWRGILDMGVVVGLAWGMVATVAAVARGRPRVEQTPSGKPSVEGKI